MNLEESKNKIIEEIRILAKKITDIQSYNDLLLHENDIRDLYEKFIIAKNVKEIHIEIATEKPVVVGIIENDEVEETNSISSIDFKNVTELPKETLFEKKEDIPHIKVPEIKLKPLHAPQSKKIQMDLNDRFAFISQLFNGNSQELDLIIETLNLTPTVEDSNKIISELKQKNNWTGEKEEFAERLEILNQKRFE